MARHVPFAAFLAIRQFASSPPRHQQLATTLPRSCLLNPIASMQPRPHPVSPLYRDTPQQRFDQAMYSPFNQQPHPQRAASIIQSPYPPTTSSSTPSVNMTMAMMEVERRKRPHHPHHPRVNEEDWHRATMDEARRASFSDEALPCTLMGVLPGGYPHAFASGQASPVNDGPTLPTLSSVLHSPWSPPRWKAQQDTKQVSNSARPHPPPRPYQPSRGVSLVTSPILAGTTATPITSTGTTTAWQLDRATKLEPNTALSPMNESDVDDYFLQPMRRDSCSSPSSLSTVSASRDTTPDDEDDDVKTNSPLSHDRKTSRYLREMDRRAILERLARGEKQATLAKEYHVSRAAICNLYKHRHEVMARTDEDPFAKHPKKRKNKKTLKSRRSRSLRLTNSSGLHGPDSDTRAVVTPPSAPNHVHQVQSDAVLLLLTVMSDRRSSVEEFRRASERVLWLLVEEGLAVVPIKLTQVTISAESKVVGVTAEHPPCAISMEQHSVPMLEVFQLLEPDRPSGRIRAEGNQGNLHLSDDELPATLKYHNVFLYDVAVVSCDTVRAMIECVKRRGALEVMIYVVALFISADVVEVLHQVYPHVQIVTTQIESHVLETQKRRRSCVDVILGRFDQVYQTHYTIV